MNDTVFNASIGKTITALTLEDNELRFAFGDGSKMRIRDDGQMCCENRYMRTDDDLTYFVGARLMGHELRQAPKQENDDGEYNEVQFLVIKTDRGEFVMSSHNEHNGYYGGICIVAVSG